MSARSHSLWWPATGRRCRVTPATHAYAGLAAPARLLAAWLTPIYDRMMSDSILGRIPVVGGLGYIERVRRVPSSFSATLQPEPENRYFRHALAVLVNGEKVGYVAPEVARVYYDMVREAPGPTNCPGRPARHTDHETSGVELLLDFTALPAPAGE